MRQFLKNITAFFLVALLGYIVAVPLFTILYPINYMHHINVNITPLKTGYLQKRIEDIPNYNKVDVLFIGSSHAYRSFDPRIFTAYGVSIFNLGSSAQTPIQTEYLLKKYIDHINPDTVIIEVYPCVFTIDGLESTLDIVVNDRLDAGMLALCYVYPTPVPLNTLLYRSIMNKEFSDYLDVYIPGGFVESAARKEGIESVIEPNELKFRPEQFKAFYRTLDFLNERGTPFILVQAPYTKQLYDSFLNLDDFNHQMDSVGEYYNYNNYPIFDDKMHFYDSDHLNQAGVEIFNKHFLEQTLKLGLRSSKSSV